MGLVTTISFPTLGGHNYSSESNKISTSIPLLHPTRKRCPWYNHYREIYLAFSQVQQHERLNHNLATLLVVSSENSDPMSEFRKLADFNRNEQKRMADLSDEKVTWILIGQN